MDHPNQQDPIKPGLKTSEFWSAKVAQVVLLIVALLTATGVLKSEDQTHITNSLNDLIAAASTVSIAIIEAFYSVSRGLAKKQ